ncbi:MAG: type II toxin-antitoxin system VapC family toxin [Candidatus Asgardarchaeia archaeon]
MYLVDTNIFLEIFLEQKKADEAEEFLRKIPSEHLHISDFSLYSIGIILFRQGKHETFLDFVEDVFMRGKITILRLSLFDVNEIIKSSKSFNLDFDDAYQYTIAKKYGLKIVSFDSDFDRTDLGRLLPSQILKS